VPNRISMLEQKNWLVDRDPRPTSYGSSSVPLTLQSAAANMAYPSSRHEFPRSSSAAWKVDSPLSATYLGDAIEPIYNAVSIIELAADKVRRKSSCLLHRKQLIRIYPTTGHKVPSCIYRSQDALLKALSE